MSVTTYLESNFSYTAWTLDVKPEDSETQVVFILHILLSGVELLSFVDVLPRGVAPGKEAKQVLHMDTKQTGVTHRHKADRCYTGTGNKTNVTFGSKAGVTEGQRARQILHMDGWMMDG